MKKQLTPLLLLALLFVHVESFSKPNENPKGKDLKTSNQIKSPLEGVDPPAAINYFGRMYIIGGPSDGSGMPTVICVFGGGKCITIIVHPIDNYDATYVQYTNMYGTDVTQSVDSYTITSQTDTQIGFQFSPPLADLVP